MQADTSASIRLADRLRPLRCVALLGLSLLAGCAAERVDPARRHAVDSRVRERGLVLDETLRRRFAEVAFGSEYSGGEHLVTWLEPVTVEVRGNLTAADREQVRRVVHDLDTLLLDTDVRLVDGGGRLVVTFADAEGFARLAPPRARHNAGYFRITWDPARHGVTRARVLVRTGIEQALRDRVIREEITQCLGLMRDVDEPGSVFSQSDNSLDDYSPLDRAVILLWEACRPLAGCRREQVMTLLDELSRGIR